MRSFGYFCYDVKQFVIYYWGKKKERRSQIESNLMFVEKWAHDFGDHHCFHLGLPWWLRWLRICLKCGRPGFDPWMGKIPWRREWLATPVILAWSVPWTEELVRDRIHGVTKSRTQLENWHTHTHTAPTWPLALWPWGLPRLLDVLCVPWDIVCLTCPLGAPPEDTRCPGWHPTHM